MRTSEIRYRRLFEAARDGILILDPDTRKITDANPFMTELLGYPHEELLGKELWEIGLLKDEAASQEAFRELREKHHIRYEDLPLQTKAGQRREVEFVSNLYKEDAQDVIQCNIRDITERKRAEVALSHAKDQLTNQAGELERVVVERTASLQEKVGELQAFSYSVSHDMRAPLRPCTASLNVFSSCAKRPSAWARRPDSSRNWATEADFGFSCRKDKTLCQEPSSWLKTKRMTCSSCNRP